MSERIRIRRALISVSEKEGLTGLARELSGLGIELISTGGTSNTLKEAGIPVTPVSEITGFPEILDGRVKTLHPAIHAGILARHDSPSHVQQLREQKIRQIELVVLNLYPFEKTIAKEGATPEEAIEQIDIGGPAMVRAAAKNHASVAVVVDPRDYERLVRELKENNCSLSFATRFGLAKKAFALTAAYDSAIASYFESTSQADALPEFYTMSLRRAQMLRYGENPHQKGALYGSFFYYFHYLHGKELSYNNILDIQSAAELGAEFNVPAAVIVKHNNPCGVGTAQGLLDAYKKALATDTRSAFGGIVHLNRPVDKDLAPVLNEIFTEVVVAPSFTDDALAILKTKKDRRLIRQTHAIPPDGKFDLRPVAGGLLLQEKDSKKTFPEQTVTVTKRKPTTEEMQSMMFAWKVSKHVRSNAIIYARHDRTLGIGAGQMSRFDSARIASMKAKDAGLDLADAAVASDAFFPFADGLLEAIAGGIKAVIQPGGSIRDDEVIRAADERNVAMVFTGVRHFKH